MIRSPEVLEQFEAAQLRAEPVFTSFALASGRLDALWAEARRLNPGLGDDWRQDMESSIAMARMLNVPPAV